MCSGLVWQARGPYTKPCSVFELAVKTSLSMAFILNSHHEIAYEIHSNGFKPSSEKPIRGCAKDRKSVV